MKKSNFLLIFRALSHNLLPVWLSLLIVAYSNYASRQVAIVQIQQKLRDRFLDYKPVLDSLGIEDYPGKISSYSEKERNQVRRYWSEIVFNEFITINRFGSGMLKNSWPETYGDWASGALTKYKVMREEYCIFLKDRSYLGSFYSDFKETIESDFKKANNGKGLDCTAEERSRSVAIKPRTSKIIL
jgi:hypothetical protein